MDLVSADYGPVARAIETGDRDAIHWEVLKYVSEYEQEFIWKLSSPFVERLLDKREWVIVLFTVFLPAVSFLIGWYVH
jgi:hypothetical protein